MLILQCGGHHHHDMTYSDRDFGGHADSRIFPVRCNACRIENSWWFHNCTSIGIVLCAIPATLLTRGIFGT